MKLCPECERAMSRDTSTGTVRFRCFCGVELDGGPMDALIASESLTAERNTEMFQRLIHHSAHSRTNQQVSRDCPECGLDYMTQIRVSDQEVVVWTCRCGFTSTDAAAAASES